MGVISDLSEALQITQKWRETKHLWDKERYTHLKSEFQKIWKTDKKIDTGEWPKQACSSDSPWSMAWPSVCFLRAAWHSALTLPLLRPMVSALPGQAGCLLRNTKLSQEYLAQDGTDRPCHPHRLPADILTPQIYLRHLKAAGSARDLPVSPPATDTHPLPVSAHLSLNRLCISSASQLMFHQTVSTPQNVLSVPGSRVEAGL